MIRALILFACLAGDDRKVVDVVCPVDGHKFKAVEIVSTNHWGGVDKDWCRHAFKTLPMEHYVWVCPSCKFAGKKKDFEAGAAVDDDLRKRLQEGLKPAVAIAGNSRQEDIPGHAKYDLLAQVHAVRGATPLEIAKSYLSASWAERQRGAVDLEEFDEWTEVKSGYGITKTPIELGLTRNRADFEVAQAEKLAKDLADGKYASGAKRPLALYLVVYLYRRHGENPRAASWIAELEKLAGQNSVVDAALKALQASLAVEKEYQRKAAEQFEKVATGGGIDDAARVEILYQLGEIHRRLDDKPKALSWYNACIEVLAKKIDGFDNAAMKKLVEEQRKLVEK